MAAVCCSFEQSKVCVVCLVACSVVLGGSCITVFMIHHSSPSLITHHSSHHITHHSSLITHHSSLITHHSSHHITHHIIHHIITSHHSSFITSLITSLITHHSSLITSLITSLIIYHITHHITHHNKHATHLPQDCGFKVVTHMMPDLPNMGYERDILGFKCPPFSPLTSENSSRTPPSARTASNCIPHW